MASHTQYLNLKLLGTSTSDKAVYFEEWRQDINGEGQDSNMRILDAAYHELDDAIESVSQELDDKIDEVAEQLDGKIDDAVEALSAEIVDYITLAEIQEMLES